MSPTPEQGTETREKILMVAIDEIHRVGYKAASLNSIVKTLGLSKGAFYHHFPNKKELGLAVIQDGLRQHLEEMWVEPLQNQERPLESLLVLIREISDNITPEFLKLGCPINNLALEVSSHDEDFRLALDSIFDQWIEQYAQIFEDGQERGQISKDVPAKSIASFVVSMLEGTIGLAKVGQSKKIIESNFPALIHFINSIKK